MEVTRNADRTAARTPAPTSVLDMARATSAQPWDAPALVAFVRCMPGGMDELLQVMAIVRVRPALMVILGAAQLAEVQHEFRAAMMLWYWSMLLQDEFSVPSRAALSNKALACAASVAALQLRPRHE